MLQVAHTTNWKRLRIDNGDFYFILVFSESYDPCSDSSHSSESSEQIWLIQKGNEAALMYISLLIL